MSSVDNTRICLCSLGPRTHYLLSALKARALPGGRKVDYLYVDEVQDNLLIDIACSLSPLALVWLITSNQPMQCLDASVVTRMVFSGRVTRHKQFRLVVHSVSRICPPSSIDTRLCAYPSVALLTPVLP
jgi:hypothetical protein